MSVNNVSETKVVGSEAAGRDRSGAGLACRGVPLSVYDKYETCKSLC